MDHPFKQLEWDAQQWNVPVAHGSVLGLVRLREGDGSWLAPDFGILHLSKEVDINWHSHLVAAFPSCNRNSGWISSGRGVLPAFIDLSASTSSSVANGVDMFTSLLSTFNSSATPSQPVPRSHGPGWQNDRPRVAAMQQRQHLRDTRQVQMRFYLRGGLVGQAFRLERVKSKDSTVSIQLSWRFLALGQDVSSSFRPFTRCRRRVVPTQLPVSPVPARNAVPPTATGNWPPGCTGQHAAECLIRGVQVCVVQWWYGPSSFVGE